MALGNTVSKITNTGNYYTAGQYDEINGTFVANGLIGQWDAAKSYYGGNQWYDLVNNNTFTLFNNPAVTQGNIAFTNAASSYATATVPQLATATSFLTVEGVWNITSLGGSGMMFGFSGGNGSYDILTNSSALGFNTAGGDLYGLTAAQVSALNLVNNYNHYTFVMTNNGSIPQLNQIWINGVNQPLSQVLNTTTGGRGFSVGNNIMMLNGWPAGGQYLSYKMNVTYTSFRMYNRQLSAAEIGQNYNVVAPLWNLPSSQACANYSTQANVVLSNGQLDEISYNRNGGVLRNLIASSVYLANVNTTERNYWNLSSAGLFPLPLVPAPDGTNTAVPLLESDTVSYYPVLQTGVGTTLGNTLITTPGQWYTASAYIKRPGLTPSLGTNPVGFAFTTVSTNSFTNFQISRNLVDIPQTTGQGATTTTLTPVVGTSTYGGSIKFNGTANVTSTGTNIMAFGTGNFTIEYYIWQNFAYYVNCGALDSRSSPSSTTGFCDLWYGGQYNIQIGGAIAYTATTIPRLYANWNHVAVVRTGTGTNQTQVYINGTLDGSFTCANNFTDPNFIIGSYIGGYAPIIGQIASLRITKGQALYTSNFVTPTAPPLPSANTSLLMNVIQPLAFTADTSYNNNPMVNNGTTYSAFAPNYNGWYRAAMSFQSTTKYEQFNIWANGFGGPPGDGNVIVVWGPQVESGNVATMYQPTINSQIVAPMAQRIEKTGNVYIAGALDEVSTPFPIADSSLIMYLDPAYTSSYPGSGSTWYDMSGYNNNATIVTGLYTDPPVPATPVFTSNGGGSFSFTGTSGNRHWANTAVPASTFSITSERTMSIWVRIRPTINAFAYANPNYTSSYQNSFSYTNQFDSLPNSLNPNGPVGYQGAGGILFGINNFGDYGLGYGIYRNVGNNSTYFYVEMESRVNYPYSDPSPTYYYINPTIGAPYNVWVNYAGTYSPKSGLEVLYINGVAVQSSNMLSQLIPGDNFQWAINGGGFPSLMIGYAQITGGNAHSIYLDADVGATLLYTRALSAQEIYQNFQTFRQRYGV